ncbi:putative salt-induced outer membrane protein [Paracoccus alcaliphilus]|uniref:Putative salt-induced outer membrane protein n=1 Tax=Paracoccus alcaliphilus TaxID=34002 RepID=A0A1H8LMG6_9RHOB|nr:DUF481 domain-containing protein [Paracoccus alcaliphilus]WCR18012.1 DUF481 domain-containing protein [Paracoccus alcaliphilus]SEO06315.1 putative salt-induced outer membrane protein [Paracoccus alcaliphilus]
MKQVKLLGTAAILAALSVPAYAQTEFATGGNVTGLGDVDRAITDVQDDVEDDFARSGDAYRFGPAERRQGLSGSMSLSYTGRSSNSESGTDNQDLLIGGRVSYATPQWAQTVGLLIEFTENDDGSKEEESVKAIYDAMYYINDQFYAFGLGSLNIDGIASPDELRRDGILAVGPGYRVINNDTTAWRVQGGVGVRYGKYETGPEFNGDSYSEFGWIVSSRLYHRFNENIFLTNDTDYLDSGGDLPYRLTNELGVNFAMTEQLATRVSYLTEYTEATDGASSRTDNKLGVSIVYGF